jgi:hypothetical protein
VSSVAEYAPLTVVVAAAGTVAPSTSSSTVASLPPTPGTVPVRVGVVTRVMLSVVDRPLSLADARSGVDGPASARLKISPWTVNVLTVRVLTPGPPASGPSMRTKLFPVGAPVTARAVLMSPIVPGAAPTCVRNVDVVVPASSPRKASPTPAQSQGRVAVGEQTPASIVCLMRPSVATFGSCSETNVLTPYGWVIV